MTEQCSDREFLTPINLQLNLLQRRDGLTFGTDAYLLYAYLRRLPNGTAVDLGSGTGVVSLLCASAGVYAKIYAVELQKPFAELIARNAASNHLSDRVSALCRDVRELSEQELGGTVDAVFSNPPYLTATQGQGNSSDVKNIARREIAGGIDDFCAAAGRIVKHGGTFTAVYRPQRICDLLFAMRRHRLEPKRMTLVYHTVSHSPCLVLVEGKKGGRAELYVTPPLILQERSEDGVLQDTAVHRQIYEKGVFPREYFCP